MYVLFYYSKSGFKNFLNTDGTYSIATNQAKKFTNKSQAVKYYKVNNDFPIATFMFIQGPKGGIYRASSGK